MFTVDREVNTQIGTISLDKAKMVFQDQQTEQTVFIFYGSSSFSNTIEYSKENINLLNKAFIQRKYKSLETILKEVGLNCSCNRDLGRQNFIWNDKGNKSWILQIENDSLNISTIAKLKMDRKDSVLTKRIWVDKW